LLNNLQAMLHRGTVELIVIIVIASVAFVLALACLFLAVSLRRINRRLNGLARGADGASLEQAIAAHMSSVDEAVRRADSLELSVNALKGRLPVCLQRVNLIRYDAFDDVGGEQSFALALLDAEGDGVILSSIYTRQDVRVYAKSIRKGEASHGLSREERQALALPERLEAQ
jgi:hypothetical protein